MPRFLPLFLALAVTSPVAAQEQMYHGKPLAYWLQHLQDDEPQRRQTAWKAIDAFGPQGKAAAVPVLLDMLDDLDPGFAAAAAYSLSHLRPLPESAVAALHNTVRTAKDSGVRHATIQAVGSAGPGAAVASATLASLLHDKDRDVAAAAADALAAIGPQAAEAIPELKRAFQNTAKVHHGKVEDFRNRLAHALSQIGVKAVPALQELLKNENAAAAAAAIGEIGPNAKDAMVDLLRAVDDGPMDLRAEAAWALWRVNKHPDAIPALIRCLSDVDYSHVERGNLSGTRLTVFSVSQNGVINVHCFRSVTSPEDLVTRLAEIGPPAKAATAELKRVLSNEQKNRIHADAAWALWKIARDKDAPLILANHLWRRDPLGAQSVGAPSVDRVTLERLEEIGTDARAALTALVTVYREVPLADKAAIHRLIGTIDPKTATELEKVGAGTAARRLGVAA